MQLDCSCDACICPPGVRKTLITCRTWLVGSPRRWQMWGTILLSVRLWDPNLLKQQTNQTYSIWTCSTYTQSANGWCGTYTFKVEMRQRQRPSLVLLFLCLKPPIIRSHTYWNEQMHEFNLNVKINHWHQNRTEETADHLWVGSLVHDLQEEGLVLVPDLVLCVPQPVHEARQNWETRALKGISQIKHLNMFH